MHPHLERMGVTRVADITGLDVIGLPVTTAHRPNSCSLSVVQGKGATHAAAHASAVMEAFEHYCAETPDLALRYTSIAGLERSATLIDLDNVPRLAETELSRERKALWLEGVGVRTGSASWLPFELVHMDYSLPLPPSLGCFLVTSTGLASGNTREEALIHALAELIERDAVTLWQKHRALQPETRVDPSSVDDALCRDMISRFVEAEVDFAIWNITSDIQVPSFFVTIVGSASNNWRRLYPASGSGCHPCRGVALARALSEAAQSRLTLISGARDDRSRQYYQTQQEEGWSDRLRDEFANGSMPCGFDSAPDHGVADLGATLDWLLARLEEKGIGEPVMVDLSKREIPAFVVRVIAAGLEGTSDVPGYCPGRRALAFSDKAF